MWWTQITSRHWKQAIFSSLAYQEEKEIPPTPFLPCWPTYTGAEELFPASCPRTLCYLLVSNQRSPHPFSNYPLLGEQWSMPTLNLHLPPLSHCCLSCVCTAGADQQFPLPSFTQQNKKQKQISGTCKTVEGRTCCCTSSSALCKAISSASWRTCAFQWLEIQCPHPAYKVVHNCKEFTKLSTLQGI